MSGVSSAVLLAARFLLPWALASSCSAPPVTEERP